MPLDLHVQFDAIRNSHEDYIRDLENYMTLKFLGSNRYIVGFKEKRPWDTNWQHLQRVEEHNIKVLERPLQNYWQEDDLFAPGVHFAYDFFAENIRLLDKYPEGYCTKSHFSVKDHQFDIGVYRGGKGIQNGLTFNSINQIRDEYSKRNDQKNMPVK